jgi:hypothetical protein
MIRNLLTKILVVICVACLVLGFMHNILFILMGALLLLFTAAIQFPFREEEGWECSCGYDLSFMNKKSKKCPECGEKAVLEWSAMPGDLSRQTTTRLHWTVFFFIVSIAMFLLFVALLFINK